MSSNEHKTQSLALAAAIQAVTNTPPFRIEFAPDGRGAFIFILPPDISFYQISDFFWKKNLLIDAYTYFEAVKSLKSRIYEVKHDQ